MNDSPFQDNTNYRPNLFPPFVESHYVNRRLAYFRENILTLEDEQNVIHCDTFAMFLAAIFDRNCLTFVDDLGTFPFLMEVIDRTDITKKSTAVYCDAEGTPISVRIRIGRTTRWVVSINSWGLPGVSRENLGILRNLYDHVNTGTATTPGSLGMALQRRSWKMAFGYDWKQHRHLRPCGACITDLKTSLVGARSDLLPGQETQVFPELIELDRKNAYPAAFVEQPTGRTVRFLKGLTDGLACYFARCTVTVTTSMVLGPFPVKNLEADPPTTSYPTEPGIYETWLWNQEIELARSRGCTVDVQEGWGWPAMTRDPETWVRWMEELRDSAPDDMTRALVKVCAVAAIGRHGMDGMSYIIGNDPSETRVVSGGKFYDWFVHSIPDTHPTGMQHWFNHTLVVARIALFEEAEKWAMQEKLVATNTDAVYILPADISLYVPKGEERSGEWGYHILEGPVKMEHKRWVQWRYGSRTPGKRRVLE